MPTVTTALTSPAGAPRLPARLTRPQTCPSRAASHLALAGVTDERAAASVPAGGR